MGLEPGRMPRSKETLKQAGRPEQRWGSVKGKGRRDQLEEVSVAKAGTIWAKNK